MVLSMQLNEFRSTMMKRGAALATLFYLVLANALSTFLKIRFINPGPITVGLALTAALYLLGAHGKTLFLPFLGETVLPPTVFRTAAPTESTITVSVPAPEEATHAVFWAANPSGSAFKTPWEAYDGFKNAGVVPVVGGAATFPLFCPAPYAVPSGKTLSKHVHFRFMYPYGVLSDVHTRTIDC
jgi:hypothetical protein